MRNFAITPSIIKLHSALAAVFLLGSVCTAHAGADCGSASGVSGNVSSITLGAVDGLHFTISLKVGGNTYEDIRVWHNLEENEGRGMFSLLLSAYTSQATISITGCNGDQITAVRLAQ